MANTTWSTTDKSAVTLSGSNLIATASSSTAWVRAIDKQVTGKFYWENKPTVWANANTAVGFGQGGVVPSAAVPVGLAVVYKSGNIWLNNASTGSTLGARAVNDVIGIAVDLAAQIAWFRVAPSGNWNGSGTANPATGVGGVSVAAIVGGAISAYPLAVMGANLDAVTANFGDTAFIGTVPSGFTSGFTAGASLPANALVTQVALEQWASVASAAPTGRAKVWTGSAWVLKPVKVWSGSAWVVKPAKVWSGSAWV